MKNVGLLGAGLAASCLFTAAASAAAITHKFGYEDKIVTFTVPKTGTWQIEAAGAEGGESDAVYTSGGLGALVSGRFTLVDGEAVHIAVGGEGGAGLSGGGGGGTFVFTGVLKNRKTYSILAIASGGGGAAPTQIGQGGLTSTSGGAGALTGAGQGGTGGVGGQGGSASGGGGGGGGYDFPGSAGAVSSSGGGGGSLTVLGLVRGTLAGGSGNSGVDGGGGGFGGGGGAGYGAGGGGGYSGGGGGGISSDLTTGGAGGGGGSILSSSAGDPMLDYWYESGNGFVDMKFLKGSVLAAAADPPAGDPDPVPEPGSLALLATGLLSLGVARRRLSRG